MRSSLHPTILFLNFIFCFPLLFAGENNYEEIQVLWSPQRQREEGIVRQREAYKLFRLRAKRISDQSGIQGFLYLKKSDMQKAIFEFNRSWRFDPDNYYAYYGFGIICYEYALRCREDDLKIAYLKDSISLFRRALEFIPSEEERNLKNDLALSILSMAKLEIRRSRIQGNSLFDEAKKLLDQILNDEPRNGRFLITKSIYYYYIGEYSMAHKLLEKAKSFGCDEPNFEKDLKSKIDIRATK